MHNGLELHEIDAYSRRTKIFISNSVTVRSELGRKQMSTAKSATKVSSAEQANKGIDKSDLELHASILSAPNHSGVGKQEFLREMN